MKRLHLVGRSKDGKRLTLARTKGAKFGSFEVWISTKLLGELEDTFRARDEKRRKKEEAEAARAAREQAARPVAPPPFGLDDAAFGLDEPVSGAGPRDALTPDALAPPAAAAEGPTVMPRRVDPFDADPEEDLFASLPQEMGGPVRPSRERAELAAALEGSHEARSPDLDLPLEPSPPIAPVPPIPEPDEPEEVEAAEPEEAAPEPAADAPEPPPSEPEPPPPPEPPAAESSPDPPEVEPSSRPQKGGRGKKEEGPVESSLSPAEIQSLIRMGRSVRSVAQRSGAPSWWIRRLAEPIQQERLGVVTQMLQTRQVRPRRGVSGEPIGDAILYNLKSRGVTEAERIVEEGWSASRADNQVWRVRLAFEHRGRRRVAMWSYDPYRREVLKLNNLAAELGWRPPVNRPRMGLATASGDVPSLVASRVRPPGSKSPRPGPVRRRKAAATKRTAKAKQPVRKRAAAARRSSSAGKRGSAARKTSRSRRSVGRSSRASVRTTARIGTGKSSGRSRSR